jgi:GNAT superfamily N-acetyltransferase
MSFDIEQFWARPLALHELVAGYEAAFPSWYRSGGGSARRDVADRMRPEGLPIGFMALSEDSIVGAAALTAQGPVRPELGPWVSGLWTLPSYRRRGVATALVQRCALEAGRQGAATVYAASATAGGLFEKLGWRLRETAPYGRDGLPVFELATKAFPPSETAC